MSYPAGIATGNAVIAAALAWDTAAFQGFDKFNAAEDALILAVAAHRAATAVEHVNGPDIDADETPTPATRRSVPDLMAALEQSVNGARAARKASDREHQ